MCCVGNGGNRCPACGRPGSRVHRRRWMRFFPGSRLYRCLICRRHFLVLLFISVVVRRRSPKSVRLPASMRGRSENVQNDNASNR